ncbi:MAG TPA: hypothetical protein VMZ51_01850 [Acidimicrobiales bacterium]|nr:hypothetical protein [Acidimicrobiales bacterium]
MQPGKGDAATTMVDMRRSVAVAVAVAVVVLVLGAGLSPPLPARGADEPLKAVQNLLDGRAAAIRSGDLKAFMATVDARAPAAFREAQQRSFEGLASLPLASYALQARTFDTGDLSAGAAGRYGSARTFLPETRQVYRLRDFDDRDAVEHLWLTFVERGGRWYVASDSDLEAVGLESSHQLWDLGPVRLQATPHFLVISHPEEAVRAAALGSIAEEGMAALGPVWDLPWSERIPLVLPGSVAELQRILQSTVDLDKFVAFVSYSAIDDPGYQATAPRIFIQDDRLARYARPFQVATLVHELSHAAAVPFVGPFIPAWVHEGVSEWVSSGRPTSERRPRGGDDELPRDHEFSTGASASIVRSYRESRAAMSVLAAGRGLGAPTALLRALGEPRVEPGSTDHHVDAALRRVAATSLGDLQERWARR